MNMSEAIEIEGRVDVVALNLPADMETEQRARAQRCRTGDVLVLLEINHPTVEQLLGDRVAQELPEGIAARTTLAIAKDQPAFHVKIAPIAEEGKKFDRRRLAHSLPGTVQEAVSNYIAERATRVGMWEPRVVAQLKTKPTSGTGDRTDGDRRHALRVIGWLVGLGIVGGLVWQYVRTH